MNEAEQRAINALKEGDISGLEQLVRLYQLRALRAAYGIVGDRQTAEDVVADAFVAVYDSIKSFDFGKPFAPWFYKIVVNGALKAVRNNGKLSYPLEEMDAVYEPADRSPGPEGIAEHNELRLLLMNEIYALPAQQRAAVILRYYLDMDEASIAETLNCPVGTVKWRLHAAKQKLRESLAAHSLADGI